MVDLHVAEVLLGVDAQAQIELRAQRRGWLAVSTAAAGLTAVVLAALTVHDQLLTNLAATDRGDTAALVASLFGVFATVLVRPPEHALASRLLSWVWAVSVVSSVLPFAAAVSLLWRPAALPSTVWGVLAALACAMFLLLLATTVQARAPKRILGPWAQAPGANGAHEHPKSDAQALADYGLARQDQATARSNGTTAAPPRRPAAVTLEHGRFHGVRRWTTDDQAAMQRRVDELLASTRRR